MNTEKSSFRFVALLSTFLLAFLLVLIIISIMANTKWEHICVRAGYANVVLIDGIRYCYRYDEGGEIDLLKLEIAQNIVKERN